MGPLATLMVALRADAAPLDRALGGVRGRLVQTDASLNRTRGLASGLFAGLSSGALVAGIGAAVGAVGALGYGLFRSVSAAAGLTESLSKVGVVFGPAAAQVTAAADLMAARFGLSRKSYLDAASNIGLIGEAAGMAQGPAADLGVELTNLAADAMSFYDVPFDLALERIRSGLVGEAEPMRQFGVMLSEAAVQNEAMRLGLTNSNKQLDDQMKIMARVSLIRSGMARASGDLARTAESPSNRMRAIAGRAENFMVDVGAALMPAFSAGLDVVESTLTTLGALFTANRATIAGWATSLAGTIGDTFAWIRTTVGGAVDTIGAIYNNWGALTEIVGLTIYQALADIPAVFSWLIDSALAFGTWLGTNWTSLISDAFASVLAIAGNFRDVFADMFTEIAAIMRDPTRILEADLSKFNPVEQFRRLVDLSGAKLTTPGLDLPALELDRTETDRRIAELTAGMTDAGTTAGTGAGAPGAPGVPGRRSVPAAAVPGAVGGEVAKAAEPKARTEDLASFARRLQEGAFGGDTAKKQLAATEKGNATLDKIATALTPRASGDTAVFAA